MADEKKPPGWNKFNALLRRVVAVPKEQVTKKIERARRKHPRSIENSQEK